MDNKRNAYFFLKSLHKKLNNEIPSPQSISEEIPVIVSNAKNDDSKCHMRQPEDAFIHHYAFPVLFKHMQTEKGIDSETAIQSLLTEYYRHMPQYSKDTPARKLSHPFNKSIGVSTKNIIKRWKGELKGAKLKQSCPDFALRPPFPYKIVFEAKYFSKGGLESAESEFVRDVYQAFFYRGLPLVKSENNSPDWDYDYSCLFAYDASPNGTLLEVWNNLGNDVKKGFWDSANIYVMIIRGNETEQCGD